MFSAKIFVPKQPRSPYKTPDNDMSINGLTLTDCDSFTMASGEWGGLYRKEAIFSHLV